MIFVILAFALPAHLQAQGTEPVVHAVVFFSPTCPHCHEVITYHLIPLQEQYGRQLVLLGMDITQSWANDLYWDAIRYYKVPTEDWAVPFLVVGDTVLVGGVRIPSRFPTIIEEGLAAGGIDLPNYPSLVTFLREKNLLDPRYPDRLVARQAPAPEDEPPPPTDSTAGEVPAVAEDTAVAEESAAAGDSLPAGETVVEAGGVSEVDTVQEGPPAQRDTVSVEDSLAAEVIPPREEAEEAEEREADTARGEVPPAVVRDDSAGLPRPDPGEEVPAPETLSADTAEEALGGDVAADVQELLHRVPSDQETSDSAQSGIATLGLAEAARQMKSMTMWDRFNLDPTANSLSFLVLLVMILSLILRGYPPRVKGGEWPSWVIPALVLVGVGVAAYLSYVEVTHAEAACGPVGDCNTVNQSRYAVLFGVLPVGVVGLIGYGVILTLWVLREAGSKVTVRAASVGLWGAALFGTLFSVYLTFLEPFVIGATCAWCLASALVMTLLLWATAPLAAKVWPEAEPIPRLD